MSTAGLETAIAASRDVLAAVKPEQMSDPTPCKSWNVAELINHQIGTLGFFEGGLKGEAPEGDQPNFAEGDYMAAFDAAAASAVEAFSAEGVLDKMIELPFGTMPGGAVLGLAVNDLFVHAWDVAKATGQDTDLAPELAAEVLAAAQASIRPEFRGDEPAPFGQEVDAAAGCSNADRLAAFLGRDT